MYEKGLLKNEISRTEGADRASDDALIAQAKRELPYATTAYEGLVQRHMERTVRIAESIVGNRQDAESLAQEAMLRVHSALPEFRGDCRFSTWVYRITENLCRSHLAREKREAEKRKRSAMESNMEVSVEFSMDHASTDGFSKLLIGLSSEDRSLLALRFVNDLELHEIAQVMGLKLSAMKMRYYRLLERLKDQYIEREAWS